MERNKSSASRSGKSKIGAPHHGGEIFALGSKSSSSSSNRDDMKSKVMSSSSGSKSGVSDRKREAPTPPSSSSVAKKPKLPNLGSSSQPQSSSHTSRASESSNSSSNLEYWEQVARECEPTELVTSVLKAIDLQDSDTVVALLCGAIKALTLRLKPESVLSLSLLYLAKVRPSMFCNETVTQALMSILKRDTQHTFKSRNNPSTHILAANLLARGYHNKPNWPEKFVRYYIDDAINERVWVDFDDCSGFIENICTAFGTKIPPKSMLHPELNALTPSVSQAREITDDDGDEGLSLGGNTDSSKSTENKIICSVQPRFNHVSASIEKLVIETIKEQLNRRQAPDCSTRNFLRFLSSTSGISEVRALAVSRLELWIHNGKLMKPAQELLTYICYNVSGQSARDHEVLANLIKMRLKTKPLINIYMSCLREMITLQPDILFMLLKYVVQNELSTARNPNNMGMLASIFQAKPDESARHLAAIYQEFLLQRDDCLRTLRVFLRELVKMLRYDIKLTVFCQAILSFPEATKHQIENFEFRDRVFSAMVDLVTLCMFLCVSPQIREATVSIRAGRETRGSKVLIEFYDQMSRIQCEALKWMFEEVPTLFKPNDVEYSYALNKILILVSPEQYSKGDQWPPEQERAPLMRLVAEIPIQQESILCIILIGITKEIPFKVPETVEVLEQVIRRSAGLRISEYPPLHADNKDIIDFLFTMAEYHHPENIALPVGYEPPKLAISSLYWKVWNVLLMLSAHNPTTFGAFCWEHYPMLRNLMEMCITNQFTNSKPPDEELQVAMLEKTQILEFETHLAAATSKVIITEQNSLLLSQLMLMDPMGVARRPPHQILEQFQTQNGSHKLGHLLCRSRKPDLLLDIIQRQGTSQSMPWLADLVQNSEGDFNHLPVQCLCEFLLSNSGTMDTNRDIELLNYLQRLLIDDAGDHQTSCEVLEYFLRRLSSTSKQSRLNATKGLQLLLKVFHKAEDAIDLEVFESDWLLRHLPTMPHFQAVRLIIIVQLRAACQIENNPDLVMIYIQFIAANTLHDPVPDMLEHVMDMSQLIVERSTLFSCIIPTLQTDETDRLQTLNCLFVMYNNYLIKLRDHKSPYTWPEYPDLIMVNFTDGSQLPIHLNIIQAFVILLTYSNIIPNSQPNLDYWFPLGAAPPQAFTIDTAEQVQILPDWLKLKMIRSSVDRLVDAALQDLTPDQIVLFVQNFGTPVSSMSKLLALLDRAVIEQLDIVKSAVLNTVYLAQLIEIQQTRGAKNGHIAVQALELHGEILPDHPKRDIVATKMMSENFDSNIAPAIEPKWNEHEELFEVILQNPTVTKSNLLKFRKLMLQLISTRGSAENLSRSQYLVSKVLQYLHHIATSHHGHYFYSKLDQSNVTCSLFRCLFISVPDKSSNFGYLLPIIDHCIQSVSTKKSPILFQILFNKRKAFLKSVNESKQAEKQDLIQVLKATNLTELETKGNQVLNELIKTNSDSGNVIDIIASVLKSTDLIKQENDKLYKADKVGLLVDWLADIDSELVVSTRDHQLDLLFNQSMRQFRFYLLSLLSHQASWFTLHSTVNKLLERFNGSYDSTSVLHFIAALVRNPKLWQGRDKGTPKHEQIEYVLKMDGNQMAVFAEYILNEGYADLERLSSRVQVLLQCAHPDTFNLKNLVSYVRQSKVGNEEVRRKFLQQLYLNIPPMKFIVVDLDDVYLANAKNLTGCEMDKVANYTLTAISSMSINRDFSAMSFNMELLVRKLAASHPSLILRQLSVLATLLEGRAHMDINVLRSGHHISLFQQVLGIIEILQPLVFEEPYKEALQQALNCYFKLFEIHGGIYQLLFRVMELLLAYTQKDPNHALSFIELHSNVIQDLAADNRFVSPLQQIVQGVSLLKHKNNKSLPETNDFKSEEIEAKPSTSTAPPPPTPPPTTRPDTDNTGAAAVILTPFSKQQTVPQNFTKLLNEVLRRTGDDVLGPLQELETITNKRPFPMESIFERLLSLISSPTTVIRNSSYVLLVRCLKHNPGNITTNSNVLVMYLTCLRDKDSAIALSALEFLTDMVICLQEHASEILRDVFELGIKSKHNTYDHIRRCVLALKTQHAC